MNDFSEIENELKKLRPRQPSAELFQEVEKQLADLVPEDKIVRPDRFRLNWLSLGAGLAAAAAIVILLRVDFQPAAQRQNQVAATSPAPEARATMANAGFIPADATQVVYNTRDEGLHFADGYEQPMRRLRSRTHETLQWRNAATGASLRVSYPSEQIELIPVSGQ
jgi:hypothetical protein